MKLTTNRKALSEELSAIRAIAETKGGAIPALSHAKLEARNGALTVAATDLDTSLLARVEATVTQDGGILLPARKLGEIVKALPDDSVSIATEQERAAITSGSARFEIPGLSVEDFPALPFTEGDDGLSLPGSVAELLARVEFAITADDARYYLAGALLGIEPDGIAVVTTDGHRLAYAKHATETGASETTKILVPRKAVSLLRKSDGPWTLLSQAGAHVVFGVGTSKVASKTIDARFPAWEKVITERGKHSAEVGVAEFQAALARVGLMSQSNAVSVTFRKGGVLVAAAASDVGSAEEEVSGEYDGPETTVGFNARYFIEFFGAVETERARVHFTNQESAATLEPVGGDYVYTYVVMPMRT